MSVPISIFGRQPLPPSQEPAQVKPVPYMPLAEIPLQVWRPRGMDWVWNGLKVRFWSEGQGEPLLLLHGFPGSSWDWHFLWSPLAQRYRVIACDLPGFGDSEKHSLLDVSAQADLLQGLLCHLGIKRPVHLLAHDLGTRVAQELLLRSLWGRARVASCAMLNGAFLPEACQSVAWQRRLSGPFGWLVARMFDRQALRQWLAQLHGEASPLSESQLDDAWSVIAAGDGQRMLHRLARFPTISPAHELRWLEALRRCEAPLLLIAGEESPVAGKALIRRFRQLMPSAGVLGLSGVGHCPHVESPAQVLAGYLAFRNGGR